MVKYRVVRPQDLLWRRWHVIAVEANGMQRIICRLATEEIAQSVADDLMSDLLDRRCDNTTV
jgi:hypothetical protein